MFREILLGKAACFQHRHGQGIAEREHGSGAGGGREIEGASFLGHLHVQHDIAVPGETGSESASKADDLHGKTLERGKQIQKLLRLAGMPWTPRLPARTLRWTALAALGANWVFLVSR